MFRLVLDVASYPRFVPWCVGAQVHQESEVEQVATIEIARGPIKRSLTTCNRLCLDESIDMDLVDGPFRSLHGAWPTRDLQVVTTHEIPLRISFVKLLAPQTTTPWTEV